MQLIRLDHDHWNFFCPVTGKEVYKEEDGINTETFRGSLGTMRCPMSRLTWPLNSRGLGVCSGLVVGSRAAVSCYP